MNIQLFDTTLRDGTQSEGLSLSVEDKLKIARLLDGFGIHYIEGGYPGSNPKDVEFFQRAKSLDLQARQADRVRHDPQGGRPRRRTTRSCARWSRPQTPVVSIVGKTWTLHVTEVLGHHAGREPGDDRRQRRAS